MNFFYQVISVVSVTIGSIIGAGFISGRELVSFFGTENFILPLFASCLILTFCFLIVFRLGKQRGGLTGINNGIFKRPLIFNVAVLVSSFISVCGIFAGLDALFKVNVFGADFPVLSVAVIILVSFTSAYGIKGVEKASLIIIPITVITVLISVFLNGEFCNKNLGIEGFAFLKVPLYCFMNCFINLPAIADVAVNKRKSVLKISAVISSLILTLTAYFILSTVKNSNSAGEDMPLYGALDGRFAGVFFCATFAALITSALSAYYPLYFFAKEKKGKLGVAILAVMCFVFSRLGLKNIVDYAYPVIGIFGGVYIAICLKYVLTKNKRYKKLTLGDNKFIPNNSEERIWQKRKREKQKL